MNDSLKRLEKNQTQIQDPYGYGNKENASVWWNRFVTKFHHSFDFVASFLGHRYAPVMLCTIMLANLKKGWG
jgi:hypothetical protein